MADQSILSSEATRNLIRSSIAMDTWTSQSGASILRTLQDQGLGIREQDFFALRREILSLTRYEEQVARLRPDTRVPVAWIDEAPGWQLSGNFLYQARITGKNFTTGESLTRIFSLSSDEQLFKESVENAILGSVVGEEEFYDFVPEEVNLYHVYNRVGYEFPA